MKCGLLALGVLATLSGCDGSEPSPLVKLNPAARHVLIIANGAVPPSASLAREYARRRGVPSGNIVLVSSTDREEMTRKEYDRDIEGVVRRALQAVPGPIDYLLIMKGVPIRIREGGYSVDATLAGMDLPNPPIKKPLEAEIRKAISPYFNRNETFSHAKFGLYLTTRLDGYSYAQASRLIDLSLSAKPETGPFLLDEAANRKGEGYSYIQDGLARAAEILRAKGKGAILDTRPEFAAPSDRLAGYCSWGSNDGHFSAELYHKLKFKPGALAETFVSTSGRTFLPTEGGQSLIADLIAQSVTGVKGYVSEPFTFALAKPDILFDRYTSGFNLAESFYMASPVVKWKDVVIGDPLCSPYHP